MNTVKKTAGFRRNYQWVLILAVLSLVWFGAFALTGCAGSSKTKTVTTQTTDGGSGNTVTTEKHVSSEKTTSDEPGVIGSTLHVIGVVLAYPFKLVAKLFEFIF